MIDASVASSAVGIVGSAATGIDPMLTLFGDVAPTKITAQDYGTGHDWTADASGTYHTSANLAAEWKSAYAAMLAGKGDALTPTQRLAGNAEAVLEFTDLAGLSAKQQAVIREDAQRVFDAIGAGLKLVAGPGKTLPSLLTEETYVALDRAIQSHTALQELVLQGHGIPGSDAAKYAGLSRHALSVDKTTLFVGGGFDTNKAALTGIFDDAILSHLGFALQIRAGAVVQTNQSGQPDGTLHEATIALDDAMYLRTFTAKDFSKTAVSDDVAKAYVSAAEAKVTPIVAGEGRSIFGDVLPSSGIANGHLWTADANGLYHTTANLKAEWGKAYDLLQAGKASELTPIQHLEANAEAVFRNTNIMNMKASDQARYREDAQREFDAIADAMKANAALGYDPNQPFTQKSYLALERSIQSNAFWEELALQGHGLNNAPVTKYAGYTNDFQNRVDNKTLYIGDDPTKPTKAIAGFFDDAIMSHAPFAVIVRGGQLFQVNQNGNIEDPLSTAIADFNGVMFTKVVKSTDFIHPA